MVRVDAALRERGLRSRMLLQVHDELVFETDEEELTGPRGPRRGAHGGGAAPRRPARGRPQGRAELGGHGPLHPTRTARGDACRRPPARWRARRPRKRSPPSSSPRTDRCRSFPRSRPSPATCSTGSPARRSPERSCTGTARFGTPSRPSGSWRRSTARRSGASRGARRPCCLHLEDGRVMTVALRMTGALIVARRGHAGRTRTLGSSSARRRSRAALPRRAQVRAHRALARRRAAERRRWPRRPLAARGRGSRRLPDRRGVQRPWSRAAVARFTGRPLRGSPARAGRRAEDPAARPVVHRRGRQHLRRRGPVARPHPSAPHRRHARRRRRCDACIAPCARCCARGSRTAARASATTSGPMASRARTPSVSRSTGARGAVLPMRAADRPHRGRAAQHPLLSALPARAGRIGRWHEGHRPDRQHRLRQEHRGGHAARGAGWRRSTPTLVAREIRHNDADARAAIVERFGTYDAGGAGADRVRRCRSAARPRADPPPARARRGSELAARRARPEGGVEVVAVEVIKLLESPLADACDEIWVVRCDEADASAAWPSRAAWTRRRRAAAWQASRRRRRSSPPPTW